MRRSLFYIHSVVLTMMVSLPSFGIVLDMKQLMDNDAGYISKVGPLLRNLKECQIGGTHTYGNTTAIKEGPEKGKLNPTILIINPDAKAHDAMNPNVLSIVGSGFDRTLLKQLTSISTTLGFKFEKVYINNVTPLLPVAEDAPPEVSGPQKKHFSIEAGAQQPELVIGDGADRAVMRYANGVISSAQQATDGPFYPSLYHYYYLLLKNDGILLFKSAQTYDPILAFVKSFLTSSTFISPTQVSSSAIDVDVKGLETDREHPEKYIKFTNLADQTLFGKIKSSLKAKGDRVILDPIEYTPSGPFSVTHSRSLIYTENSLLTACGFAKDFMVFFGQFENHGYCSFFKQPYPHAYSMMIQATKVAK